MWAVNDVTCYTTFNLFRRFLGSPRISFFYGEEGGCTVCGDSCFDRRWAVYLVSSPPHGI